MTYFHALKELRRAQKERQAQEAAEEETAAPVLSPAPDRAAAVRERSLEPTLAPADPLNGFVLPKVAQALPPAAGRPR
jgi:hypothetical protein